MLHAAGGMDRIGRLVVRIDVGRRAVIDPSVDRLKRGGPSVLRQIVVEKSEAGADYGLAAFTGRIGDPKTRRRTACGNRAERAAGTPCSGSSEKSWILSLAASRGDE